MRTSFKSIKSILLIAIVVGLYSCRVDSEIIPLGTARLNAPLELATPTNPYYGNYTIPPNNPTTVIGVELGRMLFYENMLSKDNTMSCASCHQQEFGFTDGKAVSPGVDGISGNRSTMALANLLWDNEFFWDGRSLGLEHQALGPIQNPIELNETLPVVISKLQAHDAYPQLFFLAFGDSIISSDNLANAISQFERTLISSDSKFDKFLRGETTLTEAEMNGFQLFAHPVPGQIRGGNCGDCHLGYTFSNKDFLNNGLDVIVGVDKGREEITGNITDRGKFKVPSLRNIAVSSPYMHDGRFTTLEQVIDHYNDTTLFAHENIDFLITAGSNEPNGKSLLLSTQEKADIIAFLNTLTDETFLTNPNFSNPF